MNKLNILCLSARAVGIGCFGYSNYKLNKVVNSLNRHMQYTAMLSSDNAMKIEMFLQAMYNEFEGEVKAVVRPMLKELKSEIEKCNTPTEQN